MNRIQMDMMGENNMDKKDLMEGLQQDVEVILPIMEEAVLMARKLYALNSIEFYAKDVVDLYMILRQQASLRLLEAAYKAGLIPHPASQDVHKKVSRPGSN